QLLAEGQKLFPAPISEEAGKANTDEPARQDMEQEATQEFFGGDGHLALFAAVDVVLPSEADLAVSNGQKSMIGDGDAVGVACQIVEHMHWSAKRTLGVHYPIQTKQRPQEGQESFLRCQRF